ncbi:MAG: MFS transporter, partial [Pseudomonadota bacterium]
AICFFNLFLNYSIRLGYGVVLPEMISDLDINRTLGGSIFNAYFFTYIALTPLAGILTDRLGARRVITVSVFILGLGTLLMGSAGSFWSACLFYAIVGLGSSGIWTPILTVVQRWFDIRRKGFALGILSTGYGLGFATMGVIFPLIVGHFSWRYSWYFLGTGALVMGLFTGILLRSDPETAGYLPWGKDETSSPYPGEESQDKGKTGLFSTILTNRTFWLIGFSYFFMSCCLYGITTFMVDYARHQLGLPLERASLLATVHGIGQIIGVLTLLPLSDYLGRKKSIVLSNTFIAASLMGILLSGGSWILLFLFVGIMAVFYGAIWPMYGACAGDYFRKEIMGTVIGAWTPFYGLGAITAHWVCGFLRDITGIYTEAFLFSTAMALLGLLFMLPVKKNSPW